MIIEKRLAKTWKKAQKKNTKENPKHNLIIGAVQKRKQKWTAKTVEFGVKHRRKKTTKTTIEVKRMCV